MKIFFTQKEYRENYAENSQRLFNFALCGPLVFISAFFLCYKNPFELKCNFLDVRLTKQRLLLEI